MPGSDVTPRPTLRDVAEHAGVHPATASRALNPETQNMVRRETMEDVLKAARELDYQVNTIARSLRIQRSSTVGVLIPDIANPVFSRIVRGIEETLDPVHFTSLIAYTGGKDERVVDRLERLRRRGVDGLIVATARLNDPVMDDLLTYVTLTVQINRRTESDSIPSVTVDAATGISAVVEHLIELGHERIGFIGVPQVLSTGKARREAFLAAITAHGSGIDDDHLAETRAVSVEEGARCCRELLARNRDMTAIVTVNDLLALGCYDAVTEAGLSCPEDISITGFNDMPFTDRFDPPLTSIRFDHDEMGAAAARLILERVSTKDDLGPTPAHIRLETELIIRGSTAPVS